MAVAVVNGSSSVGAALLKILLADDMEVGSDVSYQLAKLIYLYHPIGGKLAEKPVTLAMSMPREISVQSSPGDMVKEKFESQWDDDKVDDQITAIGVFSRVYGVCSIVSLVDSVPSDKEIDLWRAHELEISYNVADPLNTAGSFSSNQNPNSSDFQKHRGVSVAGTAYHRSRCVTLMNERPVYLAFSSSAFGYVGRSVYQRALFPLKTFIRTMITDDMVARKAGLLIEKQKNAGSITDRIMAVISGVKRSLLKEAAIGEVLSIDVDESIETLDLHNLEGPMTAARKNCIENCASANNMPAKIITEESLSSSLNEGTEEARQIVQYLNGERKRLKPVYDFFDEITMHRAWNPEFFEAVKAKYPDVYGDKDYKTVFYEWKNSFATKWPSLIQEPESDQVDVAKVKFEAMTSAVQLLVPQMDPENKANLVQWYVDNINDEKLLFTAHLDFDKEAMTSFTPTKSDIEEDDEVERANGAFGDAAAPRALRAVE